MPHPNRYVRTVSALWFVAILVVPSLCFGSVETILRNVHSKVLPFIPICAILGLVYAGFSYIAGSPNARGRLVLAILGAIIGLAAPSIIQLVQSMVQ